MFNTTPCHCGKWAYSSGLCREHWLEAGRARYRAQVVRTTTLLTAEEIRQIEDSEEPIGYWAQRLNVNRSLIQDVRRGVLRATE